MSFGWGRVSGGRGRGRKGEHFFPDFVGNLGVSASCGYFPNASTMEASAFKGAARIAVASKLHPALIEGDRIILFIFL